MEQFQDMRALVDYLNHTAHAYYVLDNPLISDGEWDKLYNRLLKMEKETGTVLPDSPSLRVGGEPLSAFRQHRHITRLWSMDKAQTEEDLMTWFDRAEKLRSQDESLPPLSFGVEYKFDGLTLNLTYDQGMLVEAATRGNGEVGEAILPQTRTVKDVPLSIPWKGKIEVQGECIMRLSALDKYNQTAAEPLKNARNAAAGALRNLDPAVTASRNLSAFFYQVGTIENPPFQDQKGMVQFLKDQGFPVSPYFHIAASREEAVQLIREIEEKRSSLDFLIDGAVIKVMDQRTREQMGYTDKFPRWAVAYKFAAEEATATLENVTWELGRTGKLTPLAHVSPVDFAGVTVKKATLNNMGDIQRKDLSLGCTVWIRRSNDVIPEIMGRVEDGKEGTPIWAPNVCPACGGPLTQRGAHIFCLNQESCRPQAVARLKHFASRDAMDIDGFSEKTADLFYDKLGVRDAADLYRLTASQLQDLEGFKDKRAGNLINALNESKHCSLSKFLLAIGIPNIGKRTARDLSAAFGTLEKVQCATMDKLLVIDEVGEIVAQSVIDFFSFPENRRMIERLREAGVSPMPEEKKAGGALTGLTLVVTGTLPTFSRQEAENFIRAHGGVASGSVSKKTSYVVAGENAGSKLQKAQALGIPVISQEELIKLAENG